MLALALGLPATLTAQQGGKSNAVPRAWAAAEAANSLRSGGSPSVRPLPIGSRQSSALDAGDPTLDDGSHVELWALELQAGQQVTVTMRSGDFDTVLLMMQTDNPQVSAENDDFEDGSTDSRITFRAPATGTYALLANSFDGGETGNYTIEATIGGGASGGGAGGLGELMGGGSGSTLSYGQTISGELTAGDRTLEDGSKFDAYTFSGNAGDRIVITMNSGDFDTYLSLRSANGEEAIASNDDRADGDTDSEISVTLPATGTFTIWANAFEPGTLGSYRLTLSRR